MWWYKVALNAQRRGTASEAQERLIHFVNGYDIKIGSGSATYLAGMGDFTDGSGVKHYLTANEPNNDGHFGVMDAQTHRDYETLIAPAISINRVLSDCGYTLDRNGVEFRMPDGVLPALPAPVGRPPAAAQLPRLRPRRRDIPEAEHDDPNLAQGIEEDGGGEEDAPEYRGLQRNRMLPNANLLGWRTPVTLNKNQMAEMLNVFDDPEDVEFQNQRYCVHRELFEYVYRRLRECQRYKLSNLPKTINGSVAQQLVWKPKVPILHRNRQFISGEGQITSRTLLPTRIVAMARVLSYRSLRSEHDDEEVDVAVHPWSCIDWNQTS